MHRLVLLLIVGILGWQGYAKFMNSSRTAEFERQAEHSTNTSGLATLQATTTSYRCDGRIHCSQMTSCAEATFFLNNCPGVKMDGDNDGVACEQQWCNLSR